MSCIVQAYFGAFLCAWALRDNMLVGLCSIRYAFYNGYVLPLTQSQRWRHLNDIENPLGRALSAVHSLRLVSVYAESSLSVTPALRCTEHLRTMCFQGGASGAGSRILCRGGVVDFVAI